MLQWRCEENIVQIIKRYFNSFQIEEEWSLILGGLQFRVIVINVFEEFLFTLGYNYIMVNYGHQVWMFLFTLGYNYIMVNYVHQVWMFLFTLVTIT